MAVVTDLAWWPMSRKEVRVPTLLSDGNRDGNHGSRQRPEPAVNSQTLSHIYPELGIR